ncbi:MAG: tyrosine-type recombinase/integrase [Actinomycetota bacterium]
MGWNTVSNAESWQRAVDAWVSYLEDFGRRPWTIVQYRSEAKRFADWAVDADLRIEDISRLDVEAYVAHMRNTRGLGGRSIAARLTALRGLYDWALTRELVAWNPARAVPNPKFRKPLPEVLSADQLQVLLALPLRRGDGFIPRRDDALLKTFVWTGVRVSEMGRLDWDHVDLQAGRSRLTVVDGKGGKDRVIPVIEPLADSLLAYLHLRLPLGSTRALWVGESGRRMAVTTMRDTLRRYGNRIGVNLHPHKLRAQCGVEMIRSGASLAEVRAVLGHAGYDTLLPYTAVAADEARDALQRAAQHALD